VAVIDPKTELTPLVFEAPPAPTVTVIGDPGVIAYPVEVNNPPAPPPPPYDTPPPPPPATTKYSTVLVTPLVKGLNVAEM
jgi:hypothetical protein